MSGNGHRHQLARLGRAVRPLSVRDVLPTTPVTVTLQADPGEQLLAAWDRLVTRTPGTDVTQLSVWARVRAMEGYHPGYLLARRGDRLIGGVLLLLRHVRGLGRIGYASYGPVLAAEGEARAEVARALVLGLTRLPGVRMLFIQPAEGTDDVRAACWRTGSGHRRPASRRPGRCAWT